MHTRFADYLLIHDVIWKFRNNMCSLSSLAGLNWAISCFKGQPGSRGASGRDALDEDSGAQQGRNGNESATNTWANYRNASASPHRLERRTDGRDTPSFNVVRQQHSRTNQPPQRTQTPGHRAAMAFAQELTPTSSGTNPRMSRRDLYSTSYGPASSAASSDTSYEESSSPEIPEVQRKPQKQRTREPRMTEPSQRNPMPQGRSKLLDHSVFDKEPILRGQVIRVLRRAKPSFSVKDKFF